MVVFMTLKIILEIIAITLLSWTELLLTYLVLKKTKDYGYPNWIEMEAMPVVKLFVKKFGLKGIVVSAIVNPLILILGVFVLNTNTSFGDFFTGVIVGVLLYVVIMNYKTWQVPAEQYNEKRLGKPIRG